MELDYTVYRIHLNHTFGISRSKNDWYDIIIIFLIDGEFIGRGEAAPSIRYNESSDRILSVLRNKITLPFFYKALNRIITDFLIQNFSSFG